MSRILAIAVNTFREAVRDRVLYAVLAFAVAVLLFSLALGELSLHQEQRVVLDIGLASISLFSVVIAVFLGSSLLYKELERKTLYVILPRPIRRWEFLVGKYAGVVLTALVFLGLMGAIQLWVAAVQRGLPWALAAGGPGAWLAGGAAVLWFRRDRDRTAFLPLFAVLALGLGAVLAHRAGVALSPVLAALALTGAEAALLSGVAVFFASFSTPFFTGVLSIGVWLVGRATDDIVSLPEAALAPEIRALLGGVVRVFPNFSLFVPGRATLVDTHQTWGGPWTYVSDALAYAAVYGALLLLLSSLLFRRRDLT
jgi:ABC-type transport system involved in multi-copper enzyme maturation permease subunit